MKNEIMEKQKQVFCQTLAKLKKISEISQLLYCLCSESELNILCRRYAILQRFQQGKSAMQIINEFPESEYDAARVFSASAALNKTEDYLMQ